MSEREPIQNDTQPVETGKREVFPANWHIAANYDVHQLARRAENKLALQHDARLEPDPKVPLIGMVSRLADSKGFDLVAQGVSGIMSVTGEPGGAPVKSGIPLTDLGAGLFATVGILAALEYRHRTGRGQHVDTSLLDAGVGLSVWESTQYFSGRGIPERLGSAHRMSAPYQAFRCADGYITLGGANDRSFHRVCEVLGHPEWKEMPEFKTDGMRLANRVDLASRIEAITAGKPRGYWLELFEANNIPCGPINDYEQVFQDPQVIARELVVQVEHPTLGAIRMLGSPIKMSATPPDVARRAPLLGEHTREVLATPRS